MPRTIPMEPSARAELGRRICAIRRHKGVTRKAVAEASQSSVPYIGHVERGIRGLTVGTLVAIAGALDVDPAVLVRGLHKLHD
jgi:transcriptional regulator with XRE-family HTH domain